MYKNIWVAKDKHRKSLVVSDFKSIVCGHLCHHPIYTPSDSWGHGTTQLRLPLSKLCIGVITTSKTVYPFNAQLSVYLKLSHRAICFTFTDTEGNRVNMLQPIMKQIRILDLKDENQSLLVNWGGGPVPRKKLGRSTAIFLYLDV